MQLARALLPTRRVVLVVSAAVLASRAPVAMPPGQGRLLAANLTMLLAAAAAAVVAARRASGAERRARLHLTLVATAAGAWALGQAYWTVAEVLLDRGLPYPSPADVGFVLFVPSMLLTLVSTPIERGHRSSRNRQAVDAVALSAAALIVLWTTVLHPALDHSGEGALQATLGVLYPSSDVVLLTVSLIVLAGLPASWRPTIVLYQLATACLLVADGAFAYLTADGSYATGSWGDTGWVAGFTLLALGASLAPRATEAGSEVVAPVTRLSNVAPGIGLLTIVVAVPAFEARGETVVEHPLLVGLLVSLFAANALRSVLTRSEGEAYARQLAATERELHGVKAIHELALDAAQMIAWQWTASDDELHLGRDDQARLGTNLRLTGVSAAGFFAALHPDDREAVIASLAGASADRPDVDVEFGLTDRDGEVVHLRARGRATHDDAGVAHGFSGVLFNVTDSRQARLELARRDEAAAALTGLLSRALATTSMTELADDAVSTLGRVTGATTCELWQHAGAARHCLAAWPPSLGERAPPDRDGAANLAVMCGAEPWGTLVLEPAQTAEEPVAQGVLAILGRRIERDAAEQRLWHEARHDQLTGLPNRRLLAERIDATLGERPQVIAGLAYLDVDDFKDVNDRFGHPAGDRLLVEIARRLQAAVRPDDTVARVGGDEFAIFLVELADPLDTATLVDRLHRVLAPPVDLGVTVAYPTASIGLATTWESERTTVDLLRNADLAMYASKAGGKARTSPFEPRLLDEVERAGRLADDLRLALSRGELRAFYQPVVDLRTGEVCGAEALVRWDRPGEGIQLPDEFLPSAIRLGLGSHVTAFMLREACRWARTAIDTHRLGPFTVAVNIDTTDLLSEAFCALVESALDVAGLDPHDLCLEIVESGMLPASTAARGAIRDLRAIGVQLAIDDFGTGYSSIRQLQSASVDIVKIDRGFLDGLGTELDDSAMVAAMVTMAHALGLDVIAEGVETPKQRAVLVELGCEMAQGYLLGRPEPAAVALDHVGAGALAGGGTGSPGAARARLTVVLADDLDDDRRLLARQLERHGGYRVVGEAVDGAAAVDLVRSLDPDLVLLDLKMPGFGGRRALQQIRRESPDTTVVILSGFVSPDDEADLLAAGATGCIEKGTANVAEALTTLLRGGHAAGGIDAGQRHQAP